MFSFRFGKKNKGFEIRVAEKSDAVSFKALREGIENDSPFLLGMPGERQEDLQTVKKRLKNKTPHMFLAIDSGNVIGYLSLNRPIWKKLKHSAHIALGIHSSHRGKGIGTKLLHKAEEWAKQVGVERLELEVFEHNPAHRLYIRLGYAEEGRRIGAGRFPEGDKDVILMVKHLKSLN